MAKATPISFKEFRTKFATEEDCRNYLFEERFPDGFVCPKCGGREYYYLKKRHTCQCKNCRRQTSVTAGTVMNRTHLPLTVWFWAIYLCATDKRGISAKGLSRQLELSYESAWYLLVRIRSAMKDRDQNYMLEGIIEMDEAYLGAPKRGKKRGRGTERKKMAVAVSKTENDRPLFLRLQIIPDVSTASLQEVINGNVKPGSTIECDGLKSYPSLENVSINASNYETGDLKWVHVAIGNFKAFLLGTYHGSCGDYQPYLHEFCFRYNRRFQPSQLFSRLARAVATSCALLN
jgi:hypothetical protein